MTFARRIDHSGDGGMERKVKMHGMSIEQSTTNVAMDQSEPLGREPQRVLVVVDEALGRRVESALSVESRDREPIKVATTPSFLAAMGDLAQHPADAVVGPIHALSGMIEATAKALRELAPEARLIITAQSADQADSAEAIRCGFDLMLVEPIAPKDLQAALVGPHPTPQAERLKSSIAVPEQDSARLVTASIDAQLDATGRGAASQPSDAQAKAPSEAAFGPVPDDQLGDVDLIDALLLGQGPFEHQPMRIIRAQSGIPQIAWTGEAASASEPSASLHESASAELADLPNDNRASAAVEYHEQSFGYLHAPPPASAERLAPWADWLARWLALGNQLQTLQTLAMRDELTGVWNRRYFNRFLARILDRARRERQQVTLMVFDIDDFKRYNDRFGHGAGDDILRETARLMQSVVRDQDVVARVGGDEFAVIFWDAEQPRREGSEHPHNVMRAAKRFRRAIAAHRFPKLAEQAHGTLTVSAGLAGYPWDGQAPDQLLEIADAMAMQSKNQGKNVITYGPGALRNCHDGGFDPEQAQ